MIDSAPLLPVADAQILLNKPAVDASVVVARQGVTTRDHARRARLVLDGHAAAPIGLVVTGHTARDVYGYGYGEIWQPGAPRRSRTARGAATAPPAPAAAGAGPAAQPAAARSRQSAHAPVLAALRALGRTAASASTAAHGRGHLRPAMARPRARRPAATSSSRRSPRLAIAAAHASAVRSATCIGGVAGHLARARPASAGDHHRRAAGHRLQRDDPEALVERRHGHGRGGAVEARQRVVVDVRQPRRAGRAGGGQDALAVVARAPGQHEPPARRRGRRRRSARRGPCAARASRRAARTAPSSPKVSLAQLPLGLGVAGREALVHPVADHVDALLRPSALARRRAAVASDTQITRVAARTERGIEVRNCALDARAACCRGRSAARGRGR